MVDHESATTTARPERPRSRAETYTALVGLVLTMLLGMLDSSVVATAMPTIVGSLGGVTELTWVVTAYTLATAVSTPIWGKVGDLYGRKGTFVVALVLFMVASALAGASTSMLELILFRGLQGIAAGGLMVGSMAIIGDIAPPEERSKYLGMMTAVMPVAMISGPLLGGVVTDQLSWRWAFYINLPLGALALLAAVFAMRLPRHHRSEHRIDFAGAGLLTACLVGLTLATTWGGKQYSWGSPVIIGIAVVALLALAVFVVVERRASEPVFPPLLFSNVNFSLSSVLGFLAGAVMFGAVTFLPQYLQDVQHASATSSGLLLLPFMIGMVVTSVTAGQLIAKTGRYRVFAIAGSAGMTAGAAMLSQVGTTSSTLTVSVALVIMGLGMGLVMQPVMAISQNSVPLPHIGAAMGAANLFRTIGGSLGIALLGALFVGQLQDTLAARLGGSAGPALTSGGTQLSPTALASLPPTVRDAFVGGVVNGVQSVFLCAAVLGLVSLVAACCIRERLLPGRNVRMSADGLHDGLGGEPQKR